MTDFIQVLTTIDSEDGADLIATSIIERRLGACAQVSGPVRSTYRWQGSLEVATEWYCLIKTTGALYERVEEAIKSIHPYDEPEIIAVPIPAGSTGYLGWIAGQVRH